MGGLVSRVVQRYRSVRPGLVRLIAPSGWGKSHASRDLAATAEAPEFLTAGGFSSAENFRTAGRAALARNPDMLIVDEAERLVALPGGLEALDQIVTEALPDMPVVVASREDVLAAPRRDLPPHRVLTLERADLALDEHQVREAFAPVPLDADDVRRAMELSNAWPIAVLMMGRIARERGLAVALGDPSQSAFRDIRAYVVDQKFRAMSPAAQAACLVCSAIPPATVDDVAALAGDEAARALPWLSIERGPLMIVEGGYRPSGILEAALREAFPEEIERLREAALQRWLERDDHLRIARALADTGAFDDAVAHLEEIRGEGIERPPSRAYAALLDALPLTSVLRSHRPFLARFGGLTTAAHPDALYADVATLWVDGMLDEPHLRYATMVALGALLRHQTRLPEAEAMLAHAASTTPPDAAPEHVALHAAASAATAAQRGRLRAAQAMLAETAVPRDGPTPFFFERFATETSRVLLEGASAASRERMGGWLAMARSWHDDDVTERALVYVGAAAWLSGDDATFAACAAEIDAIRERSGPPPQRRPGAGAVVRERIDTWTGLRVLDAALTSNDPALARRLGTAALMLAEEAGLTAWIAVAALVNAAVQNYRAGAFFARAREAASAVDVPEFVRAVDDAIAGRNDPASVLAPFVARVARSGSAQLNPVRLDTFTGRVRSHGSDVPIRGKEVELLAAIALAGGSIARDALLERLWPGAGDEAAAALRASTHRLRRALDDPDIVIASGETYRLGRRVVTDLLEAEAIAAGLHAFESLTEDDRAWLEEWMRTLSGRENALSQYAWFETYAPRLEDLRHRVGMLLGHDAMTSGRYDDALRYAEWLLQLDPLDEPATELAIRAQIALGRFAEATRRYRMYRDTLRADLGLEPPDTLKRLLASPPEHFARS